MRFGLVICGLLLALACQESQSEDAIFHPAGQRALKPAGAQADALTVSGEVYVPIYSNVYWGRSGGVMEISATLSVRNVDARRPLVLTHVDYYDSRGKLIRKYLDAPVLLDPMGTVEWMIDVHDTEGGSGANFIVGWGAQGPIARPVMEAIMLAGSRGISFVSQGRPVEVVGE
ncbi:MAG: DUF3124 domain-containing protein [Bryobacterales bacterium]